MDTLLNKLEYNQIIQIINKYCKTYLGKNLCNSLIPSFEFEHVKNSLEKVNQVTSLLFQKGAPPLYEIEELELPIKMLESMQILTAKNLLDIAHLLKMASELHSYFYNDENFDLSSFNLIEDYFSSLYSNPNILKNITSKILDENTIADNASSKLSALRKSRKNLEQDVKDKLNSYIHSSKYSKYIMDPIVTVRNNRYVIPVKEEYKDFVKGFIHDTSSSGSTLYIEPTSVFEANNQIAHIKVEEELEIQRILSELSSLLYPYVNELSKNLDCIGALDLLFAKATYGKDENCNVPNLSEKKYINFYKARHPLLDKKTAVPIDIYLKEDNPCLLITGPNTGGKTVALKTIGLLLLMAYSGIPIPCHEKSSICVFSKIFVDIGDEQSIEQSLSTFSAHMMNIINITNNVNNNSLILLDELGSGTDPVEGSALAISILSYCKNAGAFICCTTHYPELKEFALVTDGFENASFEFDLENLKPTYRLLIGIPGKSNAFEISKKLGLNSDILQNASSFLKKDKVSIEELLKNIYNNKLLIDKEKEEIEKNLSQISGLRQALENEKRELEEKKRDLIEKAKLEAREIVLDAKEEVNDIIQELNKENIDIKTANSNRNKLNKKIKELVPNSSLSSYEASELEGLNASKKLNPNEVSQGLSVWVPSFNSEGTVLSSHVSKSGEVMVQVGLAKMSLKLEQLTKIANTSGYTNGSNSANGSNNKNGQVHTFSSSKAQMVSSEINVIGQNVEDAIYVIDKYIDNCVLAHLSPIRIVHGKGTGKLREGIHAYLKRNPHVKSFRLGTFGEGEMGVTVVEL